jgi:hypothetical protein
MSTGEPDATKIGHVRFGGGPSEKALPSRDLVGGLPDIMSDFGGRPRGKGPATQAPRRAADPSAWITRCRRTVRDYERRPDHHAAMVQWAMIIVMTRRLAR